MASAPLCIARAEEWSKVYAHACRQVAPFCQAERRLTSPLLPAEDTRTSEDMPAKCVLYFLGRQVIMDIRRQP